MMQLLTDQELANASTRLKAAEASLACEDLYLDDEQKALFRSFEEQRLPHEECRRRLIEHSRARRAARHLAAE